MPTDIKGVPNLRQRVYWISFTYVGFPEPNRTEPNLIYVSYVRGQK